MKLINLFLSHYEDSLHSLKIHGERYAPDLQTHGQKLLRAKHIAMRKAVAEYLRMTGEGFDYIRDDVIECEERSKHYGVPVGTFVGKIYKPSKNYTCVFVKCMRELKLEIKRTRIWQTV